MTPLSRSRLASPYGDLVAGWRGDALLLLQFAETPSTRHRVDGIDALAPAWLREPLAAYWRGDLDALRSIPCAAPGTPFQQDVWALLRTIPAGETRSYGELAAQLGRPQAARAVGAANGANPIGIVVPCHRVIGANGTLTGYAHGLARKQALLEHERAFAGAAAG